MQNAHSIILNRSHVSVRSACGTIVKQVAIPSSRTRPIVKWAGGKQWLAAAAQAFVPAEWSGRYLEPFAGGAAFFFALQPQKVVLADCNEELITTYSALKEDHEKVIDLLDDYFYDPQFYYYIRSSTPRSSHAVAARFLYLNRTCWNGLYRVNRKGKFNTPFGNFHNPTILDEDRITEGVALLRRAVLRHGDFEDTLRLAKKGDFAYCDPPYITGHENNGFLKYNAHLFSWEDQERLAQVALRLAMRGVNVLISNADHEKVVSLYSGYYYYRVVRRSAIAGETTSRGLAKEALLSSYPLLGCQSEVI